MLAAIAATGGGTVEAAGHDGPHWKLLGEAFGLGMIGQRRDGQSVASSGRACLAVELDLAGRALHDDRRLRWCGRWRG